MFILVLFDLPVKTAKDKKAYAAFRRALQYAGFHLLQNSVYTRHCASHEIAKRHTKVIERLAPTKGHISIFRITEVQMKSMVNICKHYHTDARQKPSPVEQLTLF